MDCISNGKARVRYEFGTKVSVAATIGEGFVVGMRALPGNLYAAIPSPRLSSGWGLTDRRPSLAVVDRGSRGHGIDVTRVLVGGTRRGLTPALARLLRRCSAIEPEIGPTKTDGRLTRCSLMERRATRPSLSSAPAATASARSLPTSGTPA